MNATKQADSQPAAQQHQATSATSASTRAFAQAQRLGNRNLDRLLRARLLQAKLTVGNPHDVYEQEADRVAEQVMRMPEPAAQVAAHCAPLVQRRCSDCEEELQRFGDSTSSVSVDAATETAIGSLSGGGSPLPDSVRAFMEPRFNADFGAVRVHTDAHAHELVRSVHAQAFTVGRNIVFGAGRYAPQTDGGRWLLAHELTHVIQQQAGPAQEVQRHPDAGFGNLTRTRSEGSMAEAREAAKARADVDERHWRLPDMQRCIEACHFSSTETRRWYTQHFLKHHLRHYTGEEMDFAALRRQMVYYEIQFQKSLSKDEVDAIPASAGKMGWVEEAMKPPVDMGEKIAADKKRLADYVEWVSSKEYKIGQRPYAERYRQALYKVLEDIGEDNTYSSSIVPAQELFDYGLANDLFLPREQQAVYADVAKRAAKTYDKRFKSAQFGAKLEADIGEHPSAQEVWQFGRARYLFLESERARVLGDRQANLEIIADAEADERKYQRRKFEIDTYNNHVARGKQLSSPAPFIQPFAFGAFGWAAAAAYGGSQTRLLAGETYNACVSGHGDCVSALAQTGVAVTTHYVLRNGLKPAAPIPEAPPGTGQRLTRLTDVESTNLSNLRVVAQVDTPHGPVQVLAAKPDQLVRTGTATAGAPAAGPALLSRGPFNLLPPGTPVGSRGYASYSGPMSPLNDPAPSNDPFPFNDPVFSPWSRFDRVFTGQLEPRSGLVANISDGSGGGGGGGPRFLEVDTLVEPRPGSAVRVNEGRGSGRGPWGRFENALGASGEFTVLTLPDPPLAVEFKVMAHLGSGRYKDVYAHGEGKAIGIPKDPLIGGMIVAEELSSLARIAETFAGTGIRQVNATPAWIERGPAVLPAIGMDQFAQGSKTVVSYEQGRWQIVGESPYLNERSIADLKVIKHTLTQRRLQIDDLQFLIAQDGGIAIADPLRLHDRPLDDFYAQAIDKLIEAAEQSINRRSRGRR